MIEKSLSQHIANAGLVAAVLVVALHVPYTGTLTVLHGVAEQIAEGAVPLFFIFSGYLLAGHCDERGWWKRESVKRIRTLIVPYVFWNIAYFVLFGFLSYCSERIGYAYHSDVSYSLSLVRLVSILGLNPLQFPELPFLWFVRCLVCFVVASPALAMARFRGGLWLPVCFITMWLLMPYLLAPVPAWDWSTHYLKYAWVKGLVFFTLGIYLRYNPIHVSQNTLRCFSIGGFALLHIVTGLCGKIVEIELFKLGCAVGIIWSFVPCVKLPSWLTNCAFPVYLLHRLFLTAFVVIGTGLHCLKEMQSSILMFALETIAITILCIATTLLIKRYWKRLAQFIFGGR